MRLNKIKLAGFKSFVDPTTVSFPSNLIGIVGPNGCGKSNIIDAVRWVMGEISAKHLRGESMADVVFNGSASRKPVGTASVELVFDNSDGKLGGQYAGFNEVSLKRVVSRDGTSAYFLNGARCRRKDITQLFLGTGLGARSYAIIEQGMISRVIEARPEELRGFIEEAAGISKYKERRRDTENRISHTKENLERLQDLRDEVEKQLGRLQRQAATARRYQNLKAEERTCHAELLAMKLRQINEDLAAKEHHMLECDTAMQGVIAELREIEAAIETAREQSREKSEALHLVQGRHYELGAEISRLEQAIQHARELRQRQRNELEQAERSVGELATHFERDQQQIDQLRQDIETLQPEMEAAREREHAAGEALERAELAMQAWQEDWTGFNEQARDASEKTQVERARIEQLENQLRRVTAQRERALAEIDTLAVADFEQRIEEMQQQDMAAAEQLETLESQLQSHAGMLEQQRERQRELLSTSDAARRELQAAQGRLVSLEALQKAALGQAQGKITDWLAANSLQQRPRLAQQLTVDKGWERAVETVLGNYLEAVCVDQLDAVATVIDSLTAGSVTFLSQAAGANAAVAGGDALLAHVRGHASLTTLLNGVHAVESLSDALRLRAQLNAGESIITRDGVWVGQDWLRVSRDQDVHAGVLARENEIRELRNQVQQIEERHAALEDELQSVRTRVADLEMQRDDAMQQRNQLHRSHSELKAQLSGLKLRVEQSRERLTKLRSDAEECALELTRAEDEISVARARLQEGLDEMEMHEETRLQLEQRRDNLRTELSMARGQANDARAATQQHAITLESKRSALNSIVAGLDRTQTQLQQLRQRSEELKTQLSEGEAPLAAYGEQLNEQLERRVALDQQLAAAREVVETVEMQIHQHDESRLNTERRVDEARRQLDDVRMALQEFRVRRETLLEQFAATQFDLDLVNANLSPEATIAAWEQQLSDIAGKIERLGQVNLAAIDEFKEQSERKDYLDKQFADLTEALETLESAMRKIDKETRTRFQDTFDRVNAGLKERFPRLFGGGHAYLELAGEDVLNAGVAIMARPPGKRNSTINQLSGGEKALTAVALVFSIFELNPAPFCLLDEVDAPLDDNNNIRYCETVREMSQNVQFIFITHNKVTMELADQLLGVTMHEAGVSRLVAVDTDEALRLAAM
ncbi:MAG TPA: chromosome segregation protein SMC [Steroidobacteraceae bacterium]|nr:chromosome segregation protein SMC [Steroidobacteraceae bacterium]